MIAYLKTSLLLLGLFLLAASCDSQESTGLLEQKDTSELLTQIAYSPEYLSYSKAFDALIGSTLAVQLDHFQQKRDEFYETHDAHITPDPAYFSEVQGGVEFMRNRIAHHAALSVLIERFPQYKTISEEEAGILRQMYRATYGGPVYDHKDIWQKINDGTYPLLNRY
ncbi:hypothetical protein [Lewinella sp. W8]|uniref:hypothetical protein n=1 Tax=Lewinella sp. W8 TaxID=2528208 RepID=UPI00106744BA|nr:hypothetical protein [Lewinella sp. W8]MTB50502.1 hypothetical protein [Lewinella sp. W8]